MEEALLFWNPWWKPEFEPAKLELIERPVKDKLTPFFERKEILTITGVRRCGKTKLLYLFIRELIKKIPSANILYLNFEDEMLSQFELPDIYKKYKSFMKPKGKIYLFLDEIQNALGWERWVRKMYDSFEDIKFVITGSSSILPKQKFASLFTGRMFNFELYPLDFIEFLKFKKLIIDKFFLIENTEVIKALLKEYGYYGGFPEVVLEDDLTKKILILKNYFETIRDKDIIKRFNLKEIKKFERLTFFLSGNISKPTSAKRLSQIVQISTSVIDNYFDLLEMAYFFFFVNHFAYSIKSQITYPRKCYVIDTGLTNAIGFRFSEDLGYIFENIVFLELKRKQAIDPMFELFYWKNPEQQEVDFVVKRGLKIEQIIQVAYRLDDEKTKQREIKALKKAYKEFYCKNLLVITDRYEAREKFDKAVVVYMPLWKWLMAEFF
ncbi:MAG: ATP-binding protein [bacterium]